MCDQSHAAIEEIIIPAGALAFETIQEGGRQRSIPGDDHTEGRRVIRGVGVATDEGIVVIVRIQDLPDRIWRILGRIPVGKVIAFSCWGIVRYGQRCIHCLIDPRISNRIRIGRIDQHIILRRALHRDIDLGAEH